MERQFVQVDEFSHTHFVMDNEPLRSSRRAIGANAEPDGSLHPDNLELMIQSLRDSVQQAQVPVELRTVEYKLTQSDNGRWILESYF